MKRKIQPSLIFICDFNADSEESATNVLGGLLKQVVGQLRQILEEIENALEFSKD